MEAGNCGLRMEAGPAAKVCGYATTNIVLDRRHGVRCGARMPFLIWYASSPPHRACSLWLQWWLRGAVRGTPGNSRGIRLGSDSYGRLGRSIPRIMLGLLIDPRRVPPSQAIMARYPRMCPSRFSRRLVSKKTPQLGTLLRQPVANP